MADTIYDPFDNLPDMPPESPEAAAANKISVYNLGFNEELFSRRLRNGYVIEDKRTGSFLPWGPLLKANPPQFRLLKLLLDLAKKGGPVRVIVLKGRKVGVSTALELFLLELAMQLPWSVGVVAHTDDSTAKLFSMTRNAYEHMPQNLKPDYRYMSLDRIEFGQRDKEKRDAGEHGHQASLKMRTVGGIYPFSGDTIRALHLSEAAKYDAAGDMEDQMRFIMSALQSVPKNGPSFVIAESSANGQQGFFYETWQRAVAGKNEWTPFFIGFLDDPACRMEVPTLYDWSDWPADDAEREEALVKMGASKEQLYFRRYMVRNEFNGDADLFDQEFPSTSDVAFLSSGRPVFRKAILDAQAPFVKKPLRRLSARFAIDENQFSWRMNGEVNK